MNLSSAGTTIGIATSDEWCKPRLTVRTPSEALKYNLKFKFVVHRKRRFEECEIFAVRAKIQRYLLFNARS
jgi:hypothetical protein